MLRGPFNRNFVYFCLSTDTKPTYNIEGGSELFETDTNFSYMFDGSVWQRVAVDTDVTSSVLPSGAATSAKQLADGHNVNVSNIANTPVITGFATSAKQLGDNHNVTVSNIANTPVITGFATSAKQLADGHNVNVSNIASTPVITGFATSTNQGKWNGAVSGLVTWKEADGKPRIATTPYGYDVAEGNLTGHAPWSKVGYCAFPDTTEQDLFSYAGATQREVFLIATASTHRVVTTNAADNGTVIKGDATGDTYTSTGGSLTTLEDTGHGATYFTDATTVAVGDCIILDPHGTSPEWGFVTTAAAQTLTCANGFSSGGSGSGRKYAVIDYSNQVGCHAILISYLDTTYTAKKEIVVTNGATANGVLTINSDIYRINSFRVIATGSAGKPTGSVALGNNSTPPTNTQYRSFITAGFTRARNSIYTVPAGKTLYITNIAYSYGSNATKIESCRMYLRIAQYTGEDGLTNFRTNVEGGAVIWYAYSEMLVGFIAAHFDCPIKVSQKTSLKVSGVATGPGIGTVVMRGWLE